MDKRSWPWKKKSSDKQATEKASANALDSSTQVDKVKQDNKKPKYVQVSVEAYARLTGLEDQVNSCKEQVKTLEDEVKEMNEKLSEANSEMTDKENLVKQHAKVAEEAVSGWEKAEAEAAALKNNLESVTLLKLTAEDRASHLDDALKECMRQIRNLKEEHEQKLHEIVLNKTKLFDKMKLELESNISNLDQEIMMSAAENAALSRSLQECSNMLMKLSEEKSKGEAEIERLRSNIESYEKEVNSLKYEVHIARKEAEIRNEEKNMSARSAEVANRQHIEGVKKIAKLETECQRLRSLVKKKLPGPAALAQMKLEVDNLGRDYGESRLRRSPMRPPSPNLSQLTDFSLDNTHKHQKENELLTERLLAMEEETKMLKETLAKRNSELQNLEARMQNNANDDNASCAGSWATVVISDFSYLKNEKNFDSPHKSENTTQLDLMDDFLEMEKLACLSNGSNETVLNSDVSGSKGNGGPELVKMQENPLIFMELQSKISMVLETMWKDKDTEKVISDIRLVLQDMHDTLHQQSLQTVDQELEIAISQTYDFVRILSKEVKDVPETSPHGDELNEKIEKFSAKYNEAINSEINLFEFVVDISHVLSKASELHFNIMGFKHSEVENGVSDCIDKIALPETNDCAHFSDSASDLDVPNEANLVPTSELKATPSKCSLEEFEQLKMDKDNLAVDLARCMENFESTKTRMVEKEQLLDEVKSELTSCQRSNGLAETQLKCMAESYKSLEKRTEELQTEVDLLRGKLESLDNELQEERTRHQDALTRCNNLQEQLQRIDGFAAADNDDKTSQEKDLAAAAEKLAECQETIFLLDKQFKSMRPQTDSLGSPNNVRSQNIESSIEEEPSISGMSLQDINPSKMDNPFNTPYSQLDSEANNQQNKPKYTKHRPTKSGSSFASSTPTPEKQARGFSRFFSSKGKNGH